MLQSIRERCGVVHVPGLLRNMEHLSLQIRQEIRRSFLTHLFRTVFDFCSGWLKTGKSARFVRAGSREVPTEIVQTYISVVCSTRRGTRSSEAGDEHLRSCYSGCGERG